MNCPNGGKILNAFKCEKCGFDIKHDMIRCLTDALITIAEHKTIKDEIAEGINKMSNYSVGKIITGTITAINGDELSIKFEDIGIVKLTDRKKAAEMSVGEESDFIITENHGSYFSVDFAHAIYKKSDKVQQNNWASITVGHTKALNLIKALRKVAEGFKNELDQSSDKWRRKKDDSLRAYMGTEAQVISYYESQISKFKSEYDTAVNSTMERKKTVSTVVNACKDYVKQINGDNNFGSGSIKEVEEASRNVDSAIDAKIQAYKELLELRSDNAGKARNAAIDEAAKLRNNQDSAADLEFEHNNKIICETYTANIAQVLNKESLNAYCQEVLSTKYNAARFECPMEIPEYIMLGEIGLVLSNKSQNEKTVVDILDTQTEGFGSREQDEYVVKIPYAQRLSDGISLLMSYSTTEERKYVLSQIPTLIFKLFMSFPAGKLEAIIIDPMELGKSFSDIVRLAEGRNAERIIDSRIHTGAKEIEEAITALHQKIANMIQAYGNDHKSRLKNEAVRALVITDFPVDLSEGALRNLRTIVRNGAAYGVCIFICVNEREMEKLVRKNNSLVNEVLQSMVSTKVQGNRLVYTNRIFLQPDSDGDIVRYKDNIIKTISNAIEYAPQRIVNFEEMNKNDITDSNNWFTGNYDEIAIPIGVKGANTVVKMVMGRSGGSTEHHALVVGQTGAGKSTLLHTIIISTMLNYAPDQVQMYLLDFKEGVEFSDYTRYRLPSLRVVAIKSEREYGLIVLRELRNELQNIRPQHFNRYGVSDINAYSNLPNVPKMPRLLLIFDEVQELFTVDDDIKNECLTCLSELVRLGRAMGIHVILASQDFRNCPGLETCFSQMAIRIAVKGSEDGIASILRDDNKGAVTLQNMPAGSAIYNSSGGSSAANDFFQVSYMKEDERNHLLRSLDRYYTDPVVAANYEDMQTRILLTNAENNVHNGFNRLITNGLDSTEAFGKTEDSYGLLLGLSFDRKGVLIPELGLNERDNLLIVTKDERMALGLFELSIMSVLYEELHTDADKTNALVYVVNLFGDMLTDYECDFDYMETLFEGQIKVVGISKAEEIVSIIYDTVERRSKGELPSSEKIFLMFFGINRAGRLAQSRSNDNSHKSSTIEKLQKIITEGPRYGVNSIVWGDSIRSVERVLGDRFYLSFDKRIAYGLDEDSMAVLVEESNADSLQGRTAAYMDFYGDENKNTHFRPYDIPAKEWVESFAEAYNNVVYETDE